MSRYQRENKNNHQFRDDTERKPPQRFRRQPDQIERGLTVNDLIRMPFMDVMKILTSASARVDATSIDRNDERRKDFGKNKWGMDKQRDVSPSFHDERRRKPNDRDNDNRRQSESSVIDQQTQGQQNNSLWGNNKWGEQTNQGWGIENQEQGQDKQKVDSKQPKPDGKYQNQKDFVKF